MKGILGRKVGMTSVFSEHGKNIPVTVIEALPNVVTSVLTKAQHGYESLQLSAFTRRDKTVTKPVLGHLQKSKTEGKYFIKEIRGMQGLALGDQVDLSIFKAGELVDVTGISKGKGFAGAIKRHHQKIGPKSHGGGGGSKPVRLTGSLGDVASNRVFKGQTMPGHMGHVQRSVQNLEVVAIDLANHVLLVKGSIPGPKKGFVVVKAAIKGLATKEAMKLVDVNEVNIKNHLLEEAGKVGANVNIDMSIATMKDAISVAQIAKAATKVAKQVAEKVKASETQAFEQQKKAKVTKTKATKAKATKAKATEAKATETKATEAKATEAKATEAKATEAKATEAKATEAKATEAKATEAKATEAKATEAKVAEIKTTKAKVTKTKVTSTTTPTKALQVAVDPKGETPKESQVKKVCQKGDV